jgi:hypothetical protein
MRNARHLLKPFEKCDCQHSPGSKRMTSLYGRFVIIAQQIKIFGDGLGSGFKGTVRRKTRWVKSGINLWLFLYCFAADIYKFYLKGQYYLISIKLVSAFNDHKN